MDLTIHTKFKTVDEYLAALPESVRESMETLRSTIKQAAPQSLELISYNMPAFRLNGILVWYAAFKSHIGFYPRTSAIEVFRNELSAYEVAKGTIRFPINKPVPLDLVTKIVKYRVEENLAAAMKKQSKD